MGQKAMRTDALMPRSHGNDCSPSAVEQPTGMAQISFPPLDSPLTCNSLHACFRDVTSRTCHLSTSRSPHTVSTNAFAIDHHLHAFLSATLGCCNCKKKKIHSEHSARTVQGREAHFRPRAVRAVLRLSRWSPQRGQSRRNWQGVPRFPVALRK